MIASRYLCRWWVGLCLAIVAAAVSAQTQPATSTYEPEVGQEGKDVIWVPTPQTLVDRMLDMAKLTPNDYLVDLGSGDGRTVITAAKRGARALGIEYNPDMVELSRHHAAQAGVAGKAKFIQADLFESDFSQASIITMFLLPEINIKLRPRILDMKPGTRAVSNSFTMGDWVPDEQATVGQDCESWCTAYLWIVPARVAGTWRLPQGQLVLEQKFQMVTGALKTGNRSMAVMNGRLRGDQISFIVGGTQYTGVVNSNAIHGSINSGGKTGKWRATRVARAAWLEPAAQALAADAFVARFP